jgi:hypothetical protein
VRQDGASLGLRVHRLAEAAQDEDEVEPGLDVVRALGERVAVRGGGLREEPAARVGARAVTARRELVHGAGGGPRVRRAPILAERPWPQPFLPGVLLGVSKMEATM